MKSDIQNNDTALKKLYGPELYQKIKTCKILVVGVGGIGCELIKNLSKSGFRDYTLIDLDTIEISNLNRQFYFHREHVGQYKAEVGRQTLLMLQPNLQIQAYKDSIFSAKFDNKFYSQFNIAFNALDNVKARQHLGKMCIKNNIPLVDAGSEGYHGQTHTTLRGMMECNNCHPITQERATFAICTIRSEPERPIHCVVWAKNLYNIIFGPQDQENYLENSLLKVFGDTPLQSVSDQDIEKCAYALFEECFYTSITRLQNNKIQDKQVENLNSDSQMQQSDSQPPKAKLLTDQSRFPLKFQDSQSISNFPETIFEKHNRKLLPDELIKPISYSADIFVKSFIQLLKERKDRIGQILFDKDDDLCLNFVSSAANLRTYNFMNKNNPNQKLEYLSKRKVKEMAGNIIPAIASTNAMLAAIQVSEAIKLLKDQLKDLKFITVSNVSTNKIQPQQHKSSNLFCSVCSERNCYIHLKCDFEQVTFGQLRKILDEQYSLINCIIYQDKQEKWDPDNDAYTFYDNKLLKNYLDIEQRGNSLGASLWARKSEQNQLQWFIDLESFTAAPGEQTIMTKAISSPECIKQQQIRYIKKYTEHQRTIKDFLYREYGYD